MSWSSRRRSRTSGRVSVRCREISGWSPRGAGPERPEPGAGKDPTEQGAPPRPGRQVRDVKCGGDSTERHQSQFGGWGPIQSAEGRDRCWKKCRRRIECHCRIRTYRRREGGQKGLRRRRAKRSAARIALPVEEIAPPATDFGLVWFRQGAPHRVGSKPDPTGSSCAPDYFGSVPDPVVSPSAPDRAGSMPKSDQARSMPYSVVPSRVPSRAASVPG
jgi:hypothetical protein